MQTQTALQFKEILNLPKTAGSVLSATEHEGVCVWTDEMINAHIPKYSVVIVRKQKTAEVGQIALAVIDRKKFVLRRVQQTEDGKKYLITEDSKNSIMFFREGIEIVGVVKEIHIKNFI